MSDPSIFHPIFTIVIIVIGVIALTSIGDNVIADESSGELQNSTDRSNYLTECVQEDFTMNMSECQVQYCIENRDSMGEEGCKEMVYEEDSQ